MLACAHNSRGRGTGKVSVQKGGGCVLAFGGSTGAGEKRREAGTRAEGAKGTRAEREKGTRKQGNKERRRGRRCGVESERARLHDGRGDEAEPSAGPIVEKGVPRGVGGREAKETVEGGVGGLGRAGEVARPTAERFVDGPHAGGDRAAPRAVAFPHRPRDRHRAVRGDEETDRRIDKGPACLHHPIEAGGVTAEEGGDTELGARAEALELCKLVLPENAGSHGGYERGGEVREGETKGREGRGKGGLGWSVRGAKSED